MYQFESQIRYSEVDEDGYLTLNGIMNYLQDCSLFHSETCGCGLEWLKAKDRAWLLSGWQITIFKRPVFLEKIIIKTMPYEFQGSLGYRGYEIRSDKNELLVFANSVWCYVQPSVMKPVRITEEDKVPYGKLDEPFEWIGSRKIRVHEAAADTQMEPFFVKREHLDTNHHVNNGQYVTMACEYLPEGYKIRHLRAEYKSQAYLGNLMVPTINQEDGWFTVSFKDGEKKVYAIVSFSEV